MWRASPEAATRLEKQRPTDGFAVVSIDLSSVERAFDLGGGRQQYLDKNPFGYRCHSATGIRVPAGA